MLWTTALNLPLKQSEVDFLIPELDHDLNLYVDPLLFHRSSIPEYQAVHACIHEFFSICIDQVKKGNIEVARKMLDFPEVHETMLGTSKSSHKGRGMGKVRGGIILNEIIANKDVQTKGITHIAEMQLLIEGVGYDLISDMCTNIAKHFFIEYTQKQCQQYEIEMEKNLCLEHVFNWEELEWDDIHIDLPTHPESKHPILLVPRTVVRRFPIFDYAGFWDTTYRYILRANMLESAVHAIGKEPKVLWKDVKEKYEFSKKHVVEVLHENPELRHQYVDQFERKFSSGISPVDLFKIQGNENFNTPINDLITELKTIESGNKDAKRYEKLVLRILTRLFSPLLNNPDPQSSSHDGREIIDITYYNGANEGFWNDAKILWRATTITFELKNMDDLSNEEFFQIAARLNDIRGMIGFLISRKKDHLDIQRAYRRLDKERKVILCLTDEDLINMLEMDANGKNATEYIQAIYREFIDKS
ncbi:MULTISPECIES: hypothetical protein [Methylotenera]|uniref:hypothetical protein n=1 Tax=Methylotenera TaxID=359407 RepID=UPI00035CE4D1|nr:MULTISPECIES: hypothetical protein [Methylotenera]